MNDAMLVKRIIKQAAIIKDQIIVIKLPTIIIDNEKLLTNFAQNVQLLNLSGARVVIVHEYESVVADRLREWSGVQNLETSHFGQDKLSEFVEMIISGRINRDIVTKLCANAVQAVGISGKDGHLVIAKKSKVVTKKPTGIYDASYVGEPMLVNPEILLSYNGSDITFVVSPIACNEKGRTVIMDSDSTVSMIAASVGADHLIMLGDEDFLTRNEIKVSDEAGLQKIIENSSEVLADCQAIRAARYALKHAECFVHFSDATKIDALLLSLFG